MTTISASSLPQKVPELLAPAGGREQFFAALNAGADAVYLGLKSFNARARAENFTPDDLRELVPLAHSYGMQVLVTLNVLVKQTEVASMLAVLSTLEELEVDAIIVQDLAVASLVRTYFPKLRLHASTQMAVHNLAGVLKARALGFRRVVLARELTATELRGIQAQLQGESVEIEAFCHGSLCYSYSGLCFFSGADDARSGNRGECAYTCRQPYTIISEPGHGFLFSMRDLDTSAHLDLLVKAGIDTLKIEGRKKDAQYVSSVVRLYRQRLDALFGYPTLRQSAPTEAVKLYESTPQDVNADLALSFQRQRTSLFLKNRYHENVIDLDSPSHAGVLIGQVRSVRGAWIGLTSSECLERFDGLRILPQSTTSACSSPRVSHALPRDGATVERPPQAMLTTYDNKHTEFSLREMRSHGRRVATAASGEAVEIALPDAAAAPKIGDFVYKIRSADLKRRVEQMTHAPLGAKLKQVTLIEVFLTSTLQDDQLVLSVEARKFGQCVAAAAVQVPPVKVAGEPTLVADVQQSFQLFGDLGFRATSVTYAGRGDWFVPRATLKRLKHELAATLRVQYDAFIGSRRDAALGQLATAALALVKARRSTFAVKSDRLESLNQAITYAQENPEFALRELVFEPKRSFFSDLTPDTLAQTLVRLSQTSHLPLRFAIPAVVRAWDEPLLKRWVLAAFRSGIRHFEVANLGAFELLAAWGIPLSSCDIATDFTLYALNATATRFWHQQGAAKVCLSLEDDATNLEAHIAQLAPSERLTLQAIVYKDTPLFIAEACSLTALHGGCPTASVCGYRTLEVENPKGERFYVAHEACKSVVYAKEAYSLTGQIPALRKLGIEQYRIDFLTRPYDQPAVYRVLGAAHAAQSLADTHTANFHRTLL